MHESYGIVTGILAANGSESVVIDVEGLSSSPEGFFTVRCTGIKKQHAWVLQGKYVGDRYKSQVLRVRWVAD